MNPHTPPLSRPRGEVRRSNSTFRAGLEFVQVEIDGAHKQTRDVFKLKVRVVFQHGHERYGWTR